MQLFLRGLWDAAPAPAGIGGEAGLERTPDLLVLTWDVRLPSTPRVPASSPGFTDGLWEHDVVELFVTDAAAGDPQPRYLELEFGPGKHWLALGFDGIRRRERELRDLQPVLHSALEGTHWQGKAEIPLRDAKPWAGAGAWRGMACFVTTSPVTGERLHVTSQPLPGDRADFHQPAAWSRLTAARATSLG